MMPNTIISFLKKSQIDSHDTDIVMNYRKFNSIRFIIVFLY